VGSLFGLLPFANVIRSADGRLQLWFPIILAVVWVAMTLTALRWGAELTPTHLVSRWGRTRSIGWDRVQGFRVKRTAFGLRILEVISDDGRARDLWAPRGNPLFGQAAFDAQCEFVHQWWIMHRGDQGQPQ
jgi:hypothetical protein